MKNILCLMATMIIFSSAFCGTADSTVKINADAPKPLKTKVYHINYFVEGAVICVGIAGDIIAIPRLKNKASLSDDELAFANTDQQKNLMIQK